MVGPPWGGSRRDAPNRLGATYTRGAQSVGAISIAQGVTRFGPRRRLSPVRQARGDGATVPFMDVTPVPPGFEAIRREEKARAVPGAPAVPGDRALHRPQRLELVPRDRDDRGDRRDARSHADRDGAHPQKGHFTVSDRLPRFDPPGPHLPVAGAVQRGNAQPVHHRDARRAGGSRDPAGTSRGPGTALLFSGLPLGARADPGPDTLDHASRLRGRSW